MSADDSLNVKEQRKFIVKGERLVDCTHHCPDPSKSGYEGGSTDANGINAYHLGALCLPLLCFASGVPFQRETIPHHSADSTQNARACVYHNEKRDIVLEVK